MSRTSHDNQLPRAVIVALVLAAVIAASCFIFSISAMLHASENADSFLRDHPDTGRGTALSGSYGAAAITLIVAAVTLFAANALVRGKRWAWIVLGVLALFGLPGLFETSALSMSQGVLSLALLVTLLLPAGRHHVGLAAKQAPVGSSPCITSVSGDVGRPRK